MSVLLEPVDDARLRVRDAQAVEIDARCQVARIDRRTFSRVRPAVESVRRSDRPDDGQLVCLGEVPVALFLPGYPHDRAGAVRGQYVVRDEDRDTRAVDRVRGVRTGEHAALRLSDGAALSVAFGV